MTQIFQQSIVIDASLTNVERCFTELALMHQWLNPALRCEPLGEEDWRTDLGSRSRFVIQVPFLAALQPALISTVVEREPGLVVWAFTGFFQGRDRWEVQPEGRQTLLVNQFEFDIANPIVRFGFDRFAATWTKADMEAQLQRLKQVASRL
jgi:hypothetical protein